MHSTPPMPCSFRCICSLYITVFVFKYRSFYQSTVEFSLLRIVERPSCIVVRNIKDTLADDSQWALSHKALSRGVSSSISGKSSSYKARVIRVCHTDNHHILMLTIRIGIIWVKILEPIFIAIPFVMVRAPPLLSPLSSFEHCMVLCPRDSQLCDVCANPHHWTPEQTFTFAQSVLWSPAYSMANSFIWEWISKTGRNSFLVLVMKVQYYPDTLFSVILCLKCSLLLRTLCSVCKIQKHYKGPLCKIQKLQSQLCKIQKHYIMPVHCWIATFLTCCLKL